MQLFDWMHRVDLRTEIQEIYLHRFLFQLGLKTVTIFLPLYLYERGFTIPSIFLFFTVLYGTYIIFSWPAAQLTSRIGYKHASFISSPFLLAYYLLLRADFLPNNALFGVAVIGGIGSILYWIGMNSEMARNSHNDHRAEETGYFFSMPLIAAILSPFLGGLIITAYSFSALFLFAATVITASYLPFLLSREHYDGMNLEPASIFNRRHLKHFLTFFFRGANGLGEKVLWPLYLAVIITGALNIGGAGSIMALGGVLVNIGLGHYVTNDNRRRVLATGATIVALTWIAMSFVTTPIQAFIISFLNGTVYYIATLPLYTEVLDAAEHEDILEYFAFREIGLCTGRITLLLVFFTLFLFLPQQHAFLAGFATIAASALTMGYFGTRFDATPRRH